MKRLATAATLALAATTTLAAPAFAKTEIFEQRMVIPAPPSSLRISLGEDVLSHGPSHAEPDTLLQIADARTRKRSIRTAKPRRTVVKRRSTKLGLKTNGATARNTTGTVRQGPIHNYSSDFSP